MGNQIVIPSMGNWYDDPLKTINLHCNKILDSGTYFSTLDCKNMKTGESVIVRAYQYSEPLGENNVAITSKIYFQNIIDNISFLPGIVPFHNFFIQGTIAILVRDKFEFTLAQRLEEYPPLQPIEKLWIVYQILQIVLSLHNQEMVHGSINPNNVFLTWDLRVFLGDLAPYKPSQIKCNRPDLIHHYFRDCYMAPEQLIPQNEFDVLRFTRPTYSMDLFSVGCLIYYIYNNDHAFRSFELKEYANGNFQLNFDKIPARLQGLIHRLLSLNPSERIEKIDSYLSEAFPSNFHLLLNQFQELQKSCSISNFIRLAHPFEMIISEGEPECRLIVVNQFSRYLTQDKSLFPMLNCLDVFLDFSIPCGSEVLLSRVFPTICSLLPLPSTQIKVKVLKTSLTLLEAIDSIPEEFTGFFSGYFIPLLEKVINGANENLRCNFAEFVLIFIYHVVRLSDLHSSHQAAHLLTFIIQETSHVVLMSFVTALNLLSSNSKTDLHNHYNKYNVQIFELLEPTIASTFNINDDLFKVALIDALTNFFDSCPSKYRRSLRKSYGTIWPIILGYAAEGNFSFELCQAYASFIFWSYKHSIFSTSDIPEVYQTLDQLIHRSIKIVSQLSNEIKKDANFMTTPIRWIRNQLCRQLAHSSPFSEAEIGRFALLAMNGDFSLYEEKEEIPIIKTHSKQNSLEDVQEIPSDSESSIQSFPASTQLLYLSPIRPQKTIQSHFLIAKNSPLIHQAGVQLKPKFLKSSRISTKPLGPISPLYAGSLVGTVADTSNSVFLISSIDSDYNIVKSLKISSLFDNHPITSICPIRNSAKSVISNHNQFKIIDWTNEKQIQQVKTDCNEIVALQELHSSSNTISFLGRNGIFGISDLRTGQIQHQIKFEACGSCLCSWQEGTVLGIGFSDGFASIFESRVFLPMSLIATAPVNEIIPIMRRECSFVINSDHIVEVFDAANGVMDGIIQISGAHGTVFDGSAIITDKSDVFYLNGSKLDKSLMLLNGNRIRPMLYERDLPIRLYPNESIRGNSLHCHSSKITSVAYSKDVFISCDKLGFVNLWTVTNSK